MKKALLCLLAAALPLLSQAVRVDPQSVMKTAGNVGPGAYPQLLAVPSAQVSVCSAPANGVPCTNYATTYTSSAATLACPNNAQITIAASNACQSVSDTRGNFGFWLIPGNYTYTISSSAGNFGPYPISAPIPGVVSFLQAGTGAVIRTMQDKAREPVSVKDFGAIGDGTANDTPAIQDALTAAAAGGRYLLFPGGTYKTCAPLNIPLNMTSGLITGQGTLSIIQAGTCFAGVSMLVGDSLLSELALEQLTIDANERPSITKVVDLTRTPESSIRNYIRRVKIVRIPDGATGLVMDGCEDSTIEDTNILSDHGFDQSGSGKALSWKTIFGNSHIWGSTWFLPMDMAYQDADIAGSTIGPIITASGALAQTLLMNNVYMYAGTIGGVKAHFFSGTPIGLQNIIMQGGLITDYPLADGTPMVSFQGTFGGTVDLNGVTFFKNASASTLVNSANTLAAPGIHPVFLVKSPVTLLSSQVGTLPSGISLSVQSQPQSSYASAYFGGASPAVQAGPSIPVSFPTVAKRVTIASSIVVTGCSTSEVISVAGANVTLANGTAAWDSGAIAVNFSTPQNIAVTTQAVGCTNAPTNLQVTVELQPQ